MKSFCRVSGDNAKIVVFSEGDGRDYDFLGVRVYTFVGRRLPSNVFPMLYARKNRKSFLEKVKEVSEREGWSLSDIAICHAHTANYGIYALAIKSLNPSAMTVLHHHCLSSFGLNMGMLRHCWLYNMIQFPILRRMHEEMDCHVFISEACRKSFLAAPDASWSVYGEYKRQMRWLPYRPVRIKNSIILHNGVDKSVFNVEESSGEGREERLSRKPFVIGCVGNFQVLKDQITLLRAVKLICDGTVSAPIRVAAKDAVFKIRFVGSGDELPACRRFAVEKGIAAEFLPEVRHQELPRFYRTCDLFVLPSYFEGFGCVYTESLACGVPFIACEGQGIEDVLPEKCRGRWLFHPRDAFQLANKILNYYLHPSEQSLVEDQDIDKQVIGFLEKLGFVHCTSNGTKDAS